MVISSERLFGRPGAAWTFIMRRLIRIVPLYWAVTSIYVVALGSGFTLAHIISSYLFVPYMGPGGAMQPIHVVGWTLNYEMFFYALFALALALPRRLAVTALGVAMLGLVAAGSMTPPTADAFAFWSRPIMLNFVLGLALGLAYAEGVRLPRAVAGGLIAIAAVLYWREIGEPFPAEWRRLFVYGLPSALLLAGATLGRLNSAPRNLQGIAVMGDASYALYLIHPPVLWACRMVALKLAIPVAAAPWLYAGVVLSTACALALLANRYSISRLPDGCGPASRVPRARRMHWRPSMRRWPRLMQARPRRERPSCRATASRTVVLSAREGRLRRHMPIAAVYRHRLADPSTPGLSRAIPRDAPG